MSLSESLLPEFDHEMANTRKTLERIPENAFNWKPHGISWTMAELSTHITNIPNWIGYTLAAEALDIMPGGVPAPRMTALNTRQEILTQFDKSVAGARQALSGAADKQLLESWSLLANGKVLFTMPRIAVMRTMIFSHIIHHRAQLGLYLRLNNIPVPSIYGPTADESGM